MRDRMVLVIAHRLNTVRNADQIIVVQDGCVAAQGTHTELLSSSAAYRNLVEAYEGKKEVLL